VHEFIRVLRGRVVDDGLQFFVIDVDELDRVLGLGATTSATGSPTKRTSSSASGGRGVSGPAGPIEVCHCSLTSPFRSAAVNTNRTPGAASAGAVSMPRTAARANGLRTNRAYNMPGSTTSST